MTTQDYKVRILAVEDDLHIRILLHHLLDTHFDIAFATSFDEALEVAARQPFDLFLFDIHLQERRTGVELLNELRRMPAFRATPAVAFTAYAMHGDRDHFLGLGFCGYLAKPFVRKKLYETIQDALDHRGKSEPRVFDA